MVSLAGDRGEDVVHLLRAAYERGCVSSNWHLFFNRLILPLQDITTKTTTTRHSQVVVTALLILSTKYDFAVIRRDVIKHISRHYLTTLNEFNALTLASAPNLFGLTRKGMPLPLAKSCAEGGGRHPPPRALLCL